MAEAIRLNDMTPEAAELMKEHKQFKAAEAAHEYGYIDEDEYRAVCTDTIGVFDCDSCGWWGPFAPMDVTAWEVDQSFVLACPECGERL